MKQALILLLLAGCSEPKAQAEASPICYTIMPPSVGWYPNVKSYSISAMNQTTISFVSENGTEVTIFGGASVEAHSCN